MEIYLLTSNEGKLKAAKSTFNKYGVKLLFTDKDYDEIQADSSLEIARDIAQQAAKELNAPVIREDHSLFIEALGIPGPYMSYIERKIPANLIS
ncbi:MAG: non-canonical purine NTP pyrophosphatase, partial [Candidatus Paceibacterota bacterium]